MKTHLLILLLLVGVATQRANAQTNSFGGESPTWGVKLPAATLVDQHDASTIELNPGALGQLRGFSFVYHHAELPQAGRLIGNGDGWFLGMPIPLLKSWVFGFGVQWLRPSDAFGFANSAKMSFAGAWRFGRKLSLGLAYHTFFSSDADMDDLDTLDVGLTLLPWQWLGAALNVRDITESEFAGKTLERTYLPEILVRPLLSRRLEIGAGLRVGENTGNVDPRFRIFGEPWPGLLVSGEVEVVRRDFYQDGDEVSDVRGTIALGVDLERVGVTFGSIIASPFDSGAGALATDDAQSAWQGWTVTAKIYGEPRNTALTFGKRYVEVELNRDFNDRALIALAEKFSVIEQRRDLHGVVLRIKGLNKGMAQIQEIRDWIYRLRAAGKRSLAYLSAPDETDYYLASAADEIWLDPAAMVDLKGLQLRTVYLRGLLDKVGVEPQVVKIAEYKSAPEMFTHETASPAAREMYESLVGEAYDQITRDLGKDRKHSQADVKAMIDSGPFTAGEAMRQRMVDFLVEPNHVRESLLDSRLTDLVSVDHIEPVRDRWPVGPRIAVVMLEGEIVDGESMEIPIIGRRVVGDETIVELLTKLRYDSRVKAVVVRINSPGGSAQATDHIWRELRRLHQQKPVVVSLGNVAASGGYYSAAGGDYIFAEPGTITGSIGVFSGKFNLHGLLEKIGISTEHFAQGKHAQIHDWDRPYSEEEQTIMMKGIQYYYDLFLNAIAETRALTTDQINAVARGRVWTGSQALQHKLVDAMGGLTDAIDEAKRRAGYEVSDPLELVVLPEEPSSLLQRVIKAALSPSGEDPTAALFKRAAADLPTLLFYATSGQPLARLPFDVSFGQ